MTNTEVETTPSVTGRQPSVTERQLSVPERQPSVLGRVQRLHDDQPRRRRDDRVVVDLSQSEPTLDVRELDHRRIRAGTIGSKRAFDLFVTTVGLIVSAPIMALVVVLIRLTSRGPAVYRQARLGHEGREFECLKFRTMRRDADEVLAHLLRSDAAFRAQWADRRKVAQDPRVTRLGRFLRRTNLDELPQLINVLRGEMSIVGPRPIVADEAICYGNALSTVLSVKPGLTGNWQVNGRSNTGYDERVELDLDYIANQGLARDIAICARTAVLMTQPWSNGAH